MRKIKHKTFSFRTTEDVGAKWKLAADKCDTSVSKLFREVLQDGMEQVLNNPELQQQIRQRHAI